MANRPEKPLTAVLDVLVRQRVLDRQLVPVRTRVPPVTLALGVERAEVGPIALVQRVLPRELLEELLARAVGLAVVDRRRHRSAPVGLLGLLCS